MKAAWDWGLPRETETDERAIVEFAAELGFDTLVVRDPSPVMAERGRELDVDIVAIVSPGAPEEFTDDHPDCVQSLHPVEAEMAEALADAPSSFQRMAHRWYPLVHTGDWVCFEHEASVRHIEKQVTAALDTADGVAFDAFGFRNHYACFCDACEQRREQAGSETDAHDWDVLGEVSEAQLLETTARLYEHATAEDPDATVMNHIWPPFNPNPDYGDRLELEYCTQTIAWFYRPNWSLDRVEFEAARRARRETAANSFVPFVGMLDEPFLRRPADRLREELEIALEYGDDSLVLCTLEVPYNHEEYATVIADVLT